MVSQATLTKKELLAAAESLRDRDYPTFYGSYWGFGPMAELESDHALAAVGNDPNKIREYG